MPSAIRWLNANTTNVAVMMVTWAMAAIVVPMKPSLNCVPEFNAIALGSATKIGAIVAMGMWEMVLTFVTSILKINVQTFNVIHWLSAMMGSADVKKDTMVTVIVNAGQKDDVLMRTVTHTLTVLRTDANVSLVMKGTVTPSARRYHCKSGYSGDGVKICEPGDRSGTGVDHTCGGGCHVRNAECNRASGKCECRRGYDGDGLTKCSWNCQLCVPDAICDRENERCNCKPDYYGDGQVYCEKIPTRPDVVRVHITGQGDVIRVTDIEKPLTLSCYVTTNDESVTGQWTQPKGSQPAVITMNRLDNGTEISLRIAKPAMTDAGRYFCRAAQAEAFIDVVIEETAAENNKYGRVAMVTDCNTQRVIYTGDYGHEIRLGDAHAKQKELSTTPIYQSQVSRFRNLAVDPPSGNIYAWDEAFGKLVVLNPAKPHMLYTLDSINSLKQGDAIRFAGLALHSSQGLLYWATFTDGWMPNGTIQVASMNGQNEKQLIQLDGEPLALSLSPSYDNTDNSAGRLCWIQRSITNMFALATEMHCARLSADGRQILMKERLRQFNPTEEPSWGMVHHRGTVLWTDASRPVFYSANPARRVHVRLVCCSNRFQAIAALAKCNPGKCLIRISDPVLFSVV
ncbi:uncharacterized protein DEA37_0005493 [Paragonimus westermani]|uniref:Ig-like domain-containing protein n=1 Tax=Paragonimus westermani TaxID=34504 RepID=A0A5J4P1I2_9TREM|nr:uncharacterized protein DEA37_0005493 [Paragonimus westermani]